MSTTASAQMDSGVTIQDAAVCMQIVDREPSGIDSVFAPTVGTLYCFTRVVGAQDTTKVTHVWYHGDEERARIDLAVRSPMWRTNSSKRIMEHETGAWRVEVLDAQGNVLKTLRFSISG